MTKHFRQAMLVLSAGLALFVAACGDSAPTESPPPLPRLALPLANRIVFDSRRADTLGDVYAMTLDGGDLRRLTGDETMDACPSLSPDGNWIAFYRKAKVDTALRYDLRPDSLALMKADGTEIRMLAPLYYSRAGCPHWAPNSQAFEVGEITDVPIHQASSVTIRTVSGDGHEIARFSAAGVVGLQFSPDASHFIAETYASGLGGPFGQSIVTVNLDGTHWRTLARGVAPGRSPVGSQIAYICPGICVINEDSSGAREVAPNQPSAVFNGVPAFTSNGSKVAVRCGNDLCIVDLGTGSVSRSAVAVTTGQFQWAPDDQTLVFQCSIPPFYVGDICTIRSDGSGLTNLTNEPASDDSPSLSPGAK